MTHPKTAAVIGGGIAGAAAALAMHKAGIAPVIYEAYPQTADSTGVFLTVQTNGIDALRVLDADKPVLHGGIPTPEMTLRSGTGKWLGVMSTGSPLSDGTVGHTVARADVYQALQELVRARGIPLEHGKRLVTATDTGDSVHAQFADGSTATADILVGCDGVHSTVRKLIDTHALPTRYEGLLTTGGYASGISVNEPVGHYEMIFGRRAFFGYLPALDGRVWWFANLPQQSEPTKEQLRVSTEQQRRQVLLDAFAADAGPACRLIEASPTVAPFSAVHTVAKLRRWHRGRMVIIGDAAHAPSPTSGQGASLSVEDAVLLAIYLRNLNLSAAYIEFEKTRRKRVEPIVAAAARMNRSKAASPIGCAIRDAVMPTILRMAANNKTYKQIFDYHIDW